MSPRDFVTVHHPETGGVAQVTRSGSEGVWARRGWVPVEDEAADDLMKETKDRLAEIAEAQGVDVSSAKTKAEMITLIKEGPSSGHDE